MELIFNAKEGEVRNLNFIDRSVGYNTITDYRLSSYGFSGVYVWENSGSNQTENTDWENINFIPTEKQIKNVPIGHNVYKIY